MTGLTDRIAADLGIKKDPKTSQEQFQAWVFYSAVAQWVKTITLDTDPDSGSSRLGVTLPYLKRRALQAAADVYQVMYQKPANPSRLKRNLTWMINTMLSIGELEQHGDFVRLPVPVAVWDDCGLDRVTGLMDLTDPGTGIIGMCTYTMRQTGSTVKGLHTALSLADSHQAEATVLKTLERYTRRPKLCRPQKKNGTWGTVTVQKNSPGSVQYWCAVHGWPLSPQWDAPGQWICLI